jgi:hypothetical protein
MTGDRRIFLQGSAGLAAAAAWPAFAQSSATVPVTINTHEVSGTLPHIWEECAGSDRAAITLRESWRQDLDRWWNEAGLKRVRFHGIFNVELGVYAPSILNRGKWAPSIHQAGADSGTAPTSGDTTAVDATARRLAETHARPTGGRSRIGGVGVRDIGVHQGQVSRGVRCSADPWESTTIRS